MPRLVLFSTEADRVGENAYLREVYWKVPPADHVGVVLDPATVVQWESFCAQLTASERKVRSDYGTPLAALVLRLCSVLPDSRVLSLEPERDFALICSVFRLADIVLPECSFLSARLEAERLSGADRAARCWATARASVPELDGVFSLITLDTFWNLATH